MNTIEGLVYLSKCALDGSRPDKLLISDLSIEDLYKEARRHMIPAIIGFALKSAGLNDHRFEQAVASAQRKTIILDHECSSVFHKLDESGIWHMALKGSVLKDWYPKFGMRECADCDVLFDRTREEDVKQIMLGLDYTVEEYGRGHHNIYYKKPITKETLIKSRQMLQSNQKSGIL